MQSIAVPANESPAPILPVREHLEEKIDQPKRVMSFKLKLAALKDRKH